MFAKETLTQIQLRITKQIKEIEKLRKSAFRGAGSYSMVKKIDFNRRNMKEWWK